jgi:hypothetical protein
VRILVVLALALVLAAVVVVDANAARRPTPRERAQIVLAVSNRVSSPVVVVIRVDRIVVSTVSPGPGAPFTRFAVAVAAGRTALLGYYPSLKNWFVQSYGTKTAACRLHPSRFGGRRAAILRDLGLACP